MTYMLVFVQMTVVEAYVGKKKLDSPEDGSQLHSAVSSLLDEGITQNTSGSVFTSKVFTLFPCRSLNYLCLSSYMCHVF